MRSEEIELKMLAVERSPVTVNTASCSDVTVAPSCQAQARQRSPSAIAHFNNTGGAEKAAWRRCRSFKAPSTSNRAPGPLIFNVGVSIYWIPCSSRGSTRSRCQDVQVAIALIRRRAGRTDHDRIGGDGGYACLDRVRGGNGWVISRDDERPLALKSLKSTLLHSG